MSPKRGAGEAAIQSVAILCVRSRADHKGQGTKNHAGVLRHHLRETEKPLECVEWKGALI